MVFDWFRKGNKPAAKLAAPARSSTELSDEMHREIKRFCAEGDKQANVKQFAAAMTLYWQAFDLLPEPKTDWVAGTWILAAIGDANFLGGDFEAGRDNLTSAMHYPDAIGNPFLHLRLGQCQFELGARERAADELSRAYMGAGAEIFSKDDPKYFEFLKTRLQRPESGQW
jgi:tetratricopeptide (TPR) repeat protein